MTNHKFPDLDTLLVAPKDDQGVNGKWLSHQLHAMALWSELEEWPQTEEQRKFVEAVRQIVFAHYTFNDTIDDAFHGREIDDEQIRFCIDLLIPHRLSPVMREHLIAGIGGAARKYLNGDVG